MGRGFMKGRKAGHSLPTRVTIRGTTKPKRRRGVVFGNNMDLILMWLLAKDEQIRMDGSDEEKLVLLQKGVPWGLTLVLKDERNNALLKDGGKRVSSSAISTSLATLETRGLVRLYKGGANRTTHVQLTEAGHRRAVWKRENPEHWSELREREPQKYSPYKLKSWRRKNG